MSAASRVRRIFRASAVFAAALAFAFLGSCHLGPEEESRFDIDADSSWMDCARMEVILEDADGAALDTLFMDTLTSLAPFEALSAAKYHGGDARV